MAGWFLKIIPTISPNDGRAMERDLNKRFSRVAEKFGGALKTVGSKLKGILSGVALGVMGAIMTNPYEELNQIVDDTLKKYDDISSRAKQLGVSSGQLYQATQIAESAGISAEDFRSILTAYSVKLGEARKGTDPMLKEFTEEENILNSFFQFMKSLQNMQPTDRMFYAAKVIGEDDAAKLAELINTDVIQRRGEIFGTRGDKQTTRDIERLSSIEGQQAILKSRLEAEKLRQRADKITLETVQLQNQLAKARLEVETKNLQNFDTFARMEIAMVETKTTLTDLQNTLTPLVEKGTNLLQKGYDGLKNSKFNKWLGGVFK